MNGWEIAGTVLLLLLFIFNVGTWLMYWEDGGDIISTATFFILAQVSLIAVVLFLGTALSS